MPSLMCVRLDVINIGKEEDMYILKTNSSFDAAHFLSGYLGKCSNIHGHRWNVEIQIKGEKLKTEVQDREMLVDFSDLKDDLNNITEELDHKFIIEKGSLKENTLKALEEEGFSIIQVEFRPTAEKFAEFFYEKMEALGYDVMLATVYETPNNCASFSK